MKKTYYLEVTEVDGEYIIQSKDLPTQEECIDIYEKMFYYVKKNYNVYLMAMNWYNNEEYEIEQVRRLK